MTEEGGRDEAMSAVLSALGVALFEGAASGRLRLCGVQPAWLRRVLGRELRADQEFELGHDLPALAGFLAAAERFWKAGAAGQLESGVIEERDPAGRMHPLEALALCTARTPRAFVLRDLGSEFEELQGRFQTARETFLGYEQLRAEVEQKEFLLHCIVHDLKGPLAGIVGHLSLLESRSLTPERSREMAGKALVQARRQSEMIQLVLDVFATELERMESFETSSASAPDLRACVARAVESCAPAYAQREVKLRVALAGDDEQALPVVGRADQLVRVLVNLLENALRHAPAGSLVELSSIDEEDQRIVRIEDRGPGVPAELLPRLFQRFGRGASGGGMAGLGLYSARLTLERWGGAIGYEPREGGGARFWLRLPRPAD